MKDMSKMVFNSLVENKDTRNSDNLLFIDICKKYAASQGIDISNMSFIQVMMINSLPKYESVSRARRKCQEIFPELEAVETVAVGRSLQEEEFRKRYGRA